jgi:hypothetical protein
MEPALERMVAEQREPEGRPPENGGNNEAEEFIQRSEEDLERWAQKSIWAPIKRYMTIALGIIGGIIMLYVVVKIFWKQQQTPTPSYDMPQIIIRPIDVRGPHDQHIEMEQL